MAEAPSISVIIATYNRARFLSETIQSVLSQRFRDFELIVVDDGSSDETPKVLQSYEGQIRSFRQDNRGPSAARNLGILHARGRWIAFQDSDDLSTPNHLESLVRFVASHPGCGMVFGNGAYLGEPQHHRETIVPGSKSQRLAANGVTLRDLFEKSIFRLQASLIAKSALEAVGGLDEGIRIGEDLELAMRIWMRHPVAYLDEVVFLYRKHGDQLAADSELRLLENIRVIEKLARDFPQAREILGYRRIAYRSAYRYYRLAKSRWSRGEREGAREAIGQAVSLRPGALKYRLYRLLWT